jgi:hypothetical protein
MSQVQILSPRPLISLDIFTSSDSHFLPPRTI